VSFIPSDTNGGIFPVAREHAVGVGYYSMLCDAMEACVRQSVRKYAAASLVALQSGHHRDAMEKLSPGFKKWRHQTLNQFRITSAA
jgi:hypothetical protein